MDIIGYCIYCKEPIYDNQKFVTEDEELYHKECYLQCNTIYDPFEL